jgi:hypothetical protein
MRATFAALLLILACLAAAQQPVQEKKPSLYVRTKQQIQVLIQEHPTGAEDVTVAAIDAGYPADLLSDQVQKLGTYLGVEPRWAGPIEMRAGSPSAKFSVNGLIDKEKKVFRLQPIVRAFAGAPSPNTVDTIQILFVRERGWQDDLLTYELPGVVELEAMRHNDPDMLEYRVHLLTQDESKIVIPEKHAPPPAPNKVVVTEPSKTLYYVLLGVAGVAAGVLVYLALLRSKPRRAGS